MDSKTTKNKKNVDQRDVDHFSNIADIWWDKSGVARILHTYNEFRIPFFIKGVVKSGLKTAENLNGLKIMDVGCGAGIVSEVLAEKGGDVVGLDASVELIKTAENHRRNQPNLKLKYVCELIEDHAESHENFYDVIIASEVVEHIIDKESFLRACVKCLKPGGSIFITTWNRNWITWIARFMSENVVRIIPRGTHQYDQFIKPEELTDYMNKFNCRKFDSIGFAYTFWNESFWIKKNLNDFYGIQYIKND